MSKRNALYLKRSDFLWQQQKALADLSKLLLQNNPAEVRYERISSMVSDVLHVDGALILESNGQGTARRSDSIGLHQVCENTGNPGYRLYSCCGFCELSSLEHTPWVENDQFNDTLQKTDVLSIADYRKHNTYKPPQRPCFEEFRAGMSVALPGATNPLGLIAVYQRRPRKFDRNEKEFLVTLSHMLAGALAREKEQLELRRSEARSNAILKTAVDGIVTIDIRGTITLFNQAAQRIFGYSEHEVLGRNISMLMPEPYRSDHDAHLERYNSTGRRKIIGNGREMTGLRKDGSTFPLYLAVSEFHSEGVRFFTGIVRDISEQRRLEQEVLRISDHERRRIGQDLHDGLGQMLTGIGLLSQGLHKTLTTHHAGAAEQAHEITELIKEADVYARNLSRGLLPVDLDGGGLSGSLERLAVNAERLFGITCRFESEHTPRFYDNSVVEHLFRIAQEAISNAVKHGTASEVLLKLEANEDFAILTVTDNGKGFAENWRDKKGSGIDIMEFRANLVGASLDLNIRAEGGVRLTCLLPSTEAYYRIEREAD